jgi:predicted alpha/beta hydrolase
MQAASDIFLGWLTNEEGIDGGRHDFYVRQLWDGKGSAEIEQMTPQTMGLYARLCGGTLARAHARSGDPVAIASYMGGGDKFDRAMDDFAEAYADQNDRDYEAVIAAVESGRLKAEQDI